MSGLEGLLGRELDVALEAALPGRFGFMKVARGASSESSESESELSDELIARDLREKATRDKSINSHPSFRKIKFSSRHGVLLETHLEREELWKQQVEKPS